MPRPINRRGVLQSPLQAGRQHTHEGASLWRDWRDDSRGGAFSGLLVGDGMKIYIDCEFNGYAGELISMALVTEDGHEWYEVVMGNKPCVPWVLENVVPVLGKPRISKAQFHADLADFLSAYDGAEIIADHPADFMHLCRMMDNISAENDFRIPIECTMTLVRGSPDIAPEVPHNALSDARALRDWHRSVTA